MNNKIGVGIEEMSSKYLGVKGLDVVGKDKDGNNTNDGGIAATYAIDAIADAVAKVSAQVQPRCRSEPSGAHNQQR